jgi:hypothetical protein
MTSKPPPPSHVTDKPPPPQGASHGSINKLEIANKPSELLRIKEIKGTKGNKGGKGDKGDKGGQRPSTREIPGSTRKIPANPRYIKGYAHHSYSPSS